MRRVIFVLAMLMIVSSVIRSTAAQTPSPISVGFAEGLPLTIGQTPLIMVTVTDISNSTAQLTFLGLRWEWNNPSAWFVGSNSEKGAVLAAGQQVTYAIAVAIPDNVTVGTHRLTAYVTYRWFANGNWTGLVAQFWVTDLPFASPSQSGQGGSPQVFSLQTVAVLVLVVGIGLFLERGRIKRLLVKTRKTTEQPTPAKIVGEKPSKEEEQEEDL